MLKDVKKGKAFTLQKVEVEAIDCDFLPFVNVLKDRDELTVINMDPIEHDIQGYETARERGARILFNRPLPMNPFHKVMGMFGENAHTHLPGKPMVEKIHLRKNRNIFVMQCGFHPYMFSWGVVLDNPYYSITKEDGVFELSDIPPGEYKVVVWHPGMKAYLKETVKIEAGKTSTVNFQYTSPKGRRSAHEMHDNPRFGQELLEEGEKIIPSSSKASSIMFRSIVSSIIFLLLLLTNSTSLVLAYEVAEVHEGGTIKGTVTLKGVVPVPKAYNLITFPDPEYCGRISDGKGWRLLKDFVVNGQNQMQGVVMVVEGVIAGKPFALSIPKVESARLSVSSLYHSCSQ